MLEVLRWLLLLVCFLSNDLIDDGLLRLLVDIGLPLAGALGIASM